MVKQCYYIIIQPKTPMLFHLQLPNNSPDSIPVILNISGKSVVAYRSYHILKETAVILVVNYKDNFCIKPT